MGSHAFFFAGDVTFFLVRAVRVCRARCHGVPGRPQVHRWLAYSAYLDCCFALAMVGGWVHVRVRVHGESAGGIARTLPGVVCSGVACCLCAVLWCGVFWCGVGPVTSACTCRSLQRTASTLRPSRYALLSRVGVPLVCGFAARGHALVHVCFLLLFWALGVYTEIAHWCVT